MNTETANINTKEFAALVRVDPQTIRRALCVNGHYLGLKPLKLPNHRLLWPGDQARELAGVRHE
ncbi:MAG TPA: DNA-binding protein [Desulfobacter sp.]|nr:DNA-binding protein [Desulfobacter sp.]